MGNMEKRRFYSIPNTEGSWALQFSETPATYNIARYEAGEDIKQGDFVYLSSDKLYKSKVLNTEPNT